MSIYQMNDMIKEMEETTIVIGERVVGANFVLGYEGCRKCQSMLSAATKAAEANPAVLKVRVECNPSGPYRANLKIYGGGVKLDYVPNARCTWTRE